MKKNLIILAVLAISLFGTQSIVGASKDAELFDAVSAGDIERVKRLLEKEGADVNAWYERRSSSPLHKAVWEGHQDMVTFLIGKGAAVNARNNDGITPLHKAAKKGHRGIAAVLIEEGADVNARDYGNRTPLHDAADGGHPDVVELLEERGGRR